MIHMVIHIKGKLDPSWSDWFEGLTIRVEPGGDTILTGAVLDQCAVYGVLSRLSRLGIALISVRCHEAVEPPFPTTHPN